MRIRRYQVLLALLLALLCGSIAANIWLYQRSNEYYARFNSTRLDPFGLRSYPSGAEQLPPRSPDQRLVVFFGDSRAADWPAPAIPGLVFVNRGIGTQTSAQVVGRFAAHIVPLHPQILVIQVGINDANGIPLFPSDAARIVADCQARIKQIVELARQQHMSVVLTTIMPRGAMTLERRWYWSSAADQAIIEINAYIRSLQGQQVLVLDTTPVLADEQGILRPEYQRDFFHLNVAGYAALNKELARILKDF
jgi:lysophospholipase L1-like esterase